MNLLNISNNDLYRTFVSLVGANKDIALLREGVAVDSPVIHNLFLFKQKGDVATALPPNKSLNYENKTLMIPR